MHWAEKIADRIIKKNPDKEEYVCAAGISPSGSIHIGNFRDIATSLFVAKAIEKRGKKARLLFSWDEFDRFRKVPANVKAVDPENELEQYIGTSVHVGSVIRSIRNTKIMRSTSKLNSWNPSRNSVSRWIISYQTDMYTSGDIHVMISSRRSQKRKEIFDILDSFRTQDAQEGEREAYFPVSIFCPECGKDTTKITSRFRRLYCRRVRMRMRTQGNV